MTVRMTDPIPRIIGTQDMLDTAKANVEVKPGYAKPKLRCPCCDGHDLAIEALCKATITFQADGTPYAALPGDDLYWDRDSACSCQGCGYDGKVKDFEVQS